MNLNVNQADIDNRLIHGDIQVDSAGTGLAAAGRPRCWPTRRLKANSDNPVNGFARFIYLNTKVAPLNNLHCREAVEYAADKVTMQTAWGGPVAGGAIGSTIMPPNIVGYKSFDYYNALSQPNGDITAAKQQLQMCGQPNGFSTSLAYRSDRPTETAAVTALQASLAAAGIKVTLKGFPAGSYYTDFAGAPAYVHSHDLGMAAGGWGADWPNGFGFLDSLVAGNTISRHRQHQHLRTQRPGDQQPVHRVVQALRHGPHGGLVPDRPAGHEGRRHLAHGVPEGAAVPADEPHQRLRAGVLRHVQLRRDGRELVTVKAPA